MVAGRSSGLLAAAAVQPSLAVVPAVVDFAAGIHATDPARHPDCGHDTGMIGPNKRQTRRFWVAMAVAVAFYAAVLTGCILTRAGSRERLKTPGDTIRDYAPQNEAPTGSWMCV